MEPEVREAPEIPQPTADELLAELRQAKPPTPQDFQAPERVKFKFTLDEAILCYEKLRRRVERPSRRKGGNVFPKTILTDPAYLLEILEKRFYETPAATPVVETKRGNLKLRPQVLILDLRPHEISYFRKIIKNKEHDEERKEKRYLERFITLEAAETAEEEIAEEDRLRPAFLDPSHADHPEARLRQAVIQKALSELSKKLRMPAKDVNSLLAELMAAKGNVSEAARELGWPQRKTARRIERILRHLQSWGLSA